MTSNKRSSGLAALREMPFVQLRSSNALLDDQSALDRRYREEGALFFRAAIDPNVLRPIRDQVAGVLERWSVARWENDDLVWTGVPLPDFDRRELHDLPALNALSEANGDGSSPLKTLADAVYSRPTSVSRALTLFAIIPDDPAHTTSPHRDNISGGFANPERQDADYRRLWLPLTNIAFGDGGLRLRSAHTASCPGPWWRQPKSHGRPHHSSSVTPCSSMRGPCTLGSHSRATAYESRSRR